MKPIKSLLDETEEDEAYLRAMSKPGGFEKLMAKLFVKVDQIGEAVEVNAVEDKKHRKTPVHKAHPWTRETWIFIVSGLASFLIAAGVATGQLTMVVP